MPTYNIRGIDVDFPFEAYDCQLIYMEKVIQSLQERSNALLESPTGTGKTLCLLCATLAWRKSLGVFSTGPNVKMSLITGEKSGVPSSQSATKDLPTIIYASRTHSQIRQVIKELKRSSYRPKMVVLGSREQLCINEEVSLLRGRTQTKACHFLCRRTKETKDKKRHCAHYSRGSGYLKNNPHLGDEPIDIEDLVNTGRKLGPCPYYLSRELHKVVDILFAPYNYLIDHGYRKSLQIDWKNSILIFDEAHNLESICADAASFDLPSWLLTACISEAKNCIDLSIKRREESTDKSQNPDDFAILRALLLKLEKRISEVPIESKELGYTKPGPYIFELLAELNITQDTVPKLIKILEDATLLIEEENQNKANRSVCRLESISDMFNLIFRDTDNNHAKSYRVHVQEVEAAAIDGLKGKASRTLSWWCFHPGIAMEEFAKMNVGSIILTSGTLSPLDSFAQELKLEFPVRLENPHVITPNQIWAGVVPAGPSGFSFNSSYRNRDSLEYKRDLGNAIVNFARIVPDGLLVFFPSYYILDQCIACWKNTSHANSTTIWERISKHKKPIVEPRQSSLFLLSIEDYMAKLKDTSASGAVFFAVCRGKVSEGLDFADHAGRAVVITGLPFATRNDPKVRLKREYLDQQAYSQRQVCKLEVLTGEDWYNQQASRAVNQAVGRVIRHRHDYGAIIFCDERFAQPNRQSQISLWIQPHVKCYSKFGDVIFSLTRFFRDGGARGPTKLKLLQTEKWDAISTSNSVLDEQTNEAPFDHKPYSVGSSTSVHGTSGKIYELKTEQPPEKLYLDKFLPLTTAVSQDCPVKSSSSLLKAGRDKLSSLLGEVLPANRSSLTSCKDQSVSLKCSNNLFRNEKKLLICERETLQCQDSKVFGFPGKNEKRGEELITPCSAKRCKLSTEHDSVHLIDNSNKHSSLAKDSDSYGGFPNINPRSESSHISDSSSSQNAQVGSAFLRKDKRIIQQGDAEFLSNKNKGAISIPVLSGDKETRGSEFLVQVEEKLSTLEYREFVNLMKALKSKAMKMNEVLQSIASLFSGRERLPLLKRFKDFIPVKYHSMYEHYFQTNDGL
ncbi:PREDICTED: regulator of telomere elongation helicase 1 homolog [Prunus mume]|uniref:Regulator of telomere elongation helicase 1 homolog n=1 Tax=Prunus mume TaxID=102107 RepID=A0ABM1LP62_PRUMU|nr:PREDICTED: regulator of telomere elongation helicase 1 homolog [Prunus mume]